MVFIEYHREHLEEVDQEYAHVIEEYRNGLLLFDLMKRKFGMPLKKIL